MKTSKLFKTLAIMLSMVMSLSMVSCGDDEPDGGDDSIVTPDTPSVVDNDFIQGCYHVTLSDDYYKFYDVELTYVDVDGNQVSKQLTGNADLWGEKVAYSSANKSVSMKVVATVKSELPAYDSTTATTYNFNVYCYAQFFKFADQLQVGDLVYRNIDPVSHDLPINGTKMAEYLAKYSTKIIIDKTLEL
jgi:hypothetical protein